VLPSSPEEHYRAVCRALTTESIELRVFLSKVFTNDAEALRIKADAQSSRQELAKLDFRDWVSYCHMHSLEPLIVIDLDHERKINKPTRKLI
jgi:hypothetical protein